MTSNDYDYNDWHPEHKLHRSGVPLPKNSHPANQPLCNEYGCASCAYQDWLNTNANTGKGYRDDSDPIAPTLGRSVWEESEHPMEVNDYELPSAVHIDTLMTRLGMWRHGKSPNAPKQMERPDPFAIDPSSELGMWMQHNKQSETPNTDSNELGKWFE